MPRDLDFWPPVIKHVFVIPVARSGSHCPLISVRKPASCYCVAKTRSGTDPVHLYALYVICTQLFYNKNVLNLQHWCGLTYQAFFSCSFLKGTSPLADHHHAFLQTPLTLQIYCSLRIDAKNVGFLIIQNSNCCIMSDCHNGGKKAAKTVVFTDVF